MAAKAPEWAGEKYLTEKEVSEMTSICLSTLRNWRTTGKGPEFTKPGGTCVRYKLSSVLAFMEGRDGEAA